MMLAEGGDAEGALSVLDQALEIAPGWAAGWCVRADLAERAGLRSEAVAALRRAAGLDPDDLMGAGLRLAALGAVPVPDAMPQAYVRTLFDQYAPRFDRALVEGLDYAAPWHLRDLLCGWLAERGRDRFARVLDLGCGTGLLGEALRGSVSWLEGIDLSPGMLAEAAAKGVYDRVVEGDAVAVLSGERETCDLVAAADVLGYLGDLSAVFLAAARALVPGGLFAASAERYDGAGYMLGPGLRFAHSQAYLQACAATAGLTVAATAQVRLRSERGEPVDGLILLAGKPAVAAATGDVLARVDEPEAPGRLPQ
ncbi:class I SAM-dependent DNA methyltransferase [Microbaculum marinum]|uniref:Methyltransferase domain-containing protein n=1 Tax=Microbaculum marinum TaxID=1764581 RepID=A0AAW9RY40_9HYPH